MAGCDRRHLLKLGLATTTLLGGQALAKEGRKASPFLVELDREPDETITLWPESPPGGVPSGLRQHFVERDNAFGLRDRAANEITDPTLTIFRPKKPTGAALLIAPGGGYRHVVVEKEGWEGARWFNQFGITVYVMTYRLPHQGWAGGSDTPLQDAQRAIRLVRSRAELDGIDPARVGVMGFSAGGHVAGSLGTRFDADIYSRTDAIDKHSARPDHLFMIYPVATMQEQFTHPGSRKFLLGDAPTEENIRRYSMETSARADGPPTFFMHASDDEAVPVENSIMAYSAFQRAGIPCALHVFPRGGHGFGMRGIEGTQLASWPGLALDWWQDA